MVSQKAATRMGADRSNGIAPQRVWLMGLAAIGGAVAVNLLLLFTLVPRLNLPADFPPLQAVPITLFTALGAGAGVVIFALLARFAARPIRLFQIIAAIAFIVTLIPNIGLALNPAAAPFPGGTATAFLTLILFHIPPAVFCVWLLTAFTRATPRP